MIITADVGAVFNLFIYIWDFLPGANNRSGKKKKKTFGSTKTRVNFDRKHDLSRSPSVSRPDFTDIKSQ